MKSLKKKIMWIVLGCLLYLSGGVYAQTSPYIDHYFFKMEPEYLETRKFNGHDKIFLAIGLFPAPKGENLITVQWYSPSGIKKEENSLLLTGNGLDDKYVEFWLRLHKTSTFKQLLFNQTFDNELLGKWHVVVMINQKVVLKEFFQVS